MNVKVDRSQCDRFRIGTERRGGGGGGGPWLPLLQGSSEHVVI